MVEHYLDRLARTINENWDQPALTDFYLTEDGSAQDTSRGNHYTYGEMYAEMLRLCELFQFLGLQKGDHIAICGANSAHWAIAYLAIAVYQGISVTTIYSQTTEDIVHQIDLSDAKALFTDTDLWEDLKHLSLPQIEHVISLEEWQILRGEETKIENQESRIPNREAHFSHGNPDELAVICFTSGSTGVSKGVMLPYRSINNNITNLLEKYIIDNNSNYIVFRPFFHTAGLVCELLTQLCRGKNIFILQNVQSVENIYNSLNVVAPYMFFEVPKILSVLVEKYDISKLSSVKQIVTGCAYLDSHTEIKMKELSLPLSHTYGLTETGPLISIYTPDSYRYSSTGKILNHVILNIAPNGEILIKGENVMLGYYKDPEATARKIDKVGWLHTGDKGHLDEDGYLYVEGRLEQDMIVLPNGENIHPEDIERKINALPEVKESIVLARDGKLVAIVVLSGTIEEGRLINLVNPQLPIHSQLSGIEFYDGQLARTAKNTIKRYLYK